LDEPTASLDAKAEYQIYSHFKDLVKNRTAILISHRFSTVRLADRIIVMAEGRVVEQGTHAKLVNMQGLYASLYRAHEAQLQW
jgi:ABC-type multidrug transport system fused ATPase/permease subunit